MGQPTRLPAIAQAAKRLGLSVRMLRTYADEGTVPAAKPPSGYRPIEP